MSRRLVYLATPYTAAENWRLEQRRYEQAVYAVQQLMQRHPELVIFSPIVHCHPVDKLSRGLFNYKRWVQWGSEMLYRSDTVWVLMMDGWRDSAGIKAEIQQADLEGKPVLYVVYGTWDFSEAV